MGMTDGGMGMTEKMGTIHRAPTLGKMGEERDSIFSFFLLTQVKPWSAVITATSSGPPTPGISPGLAIMPSEKRCIAEVV